MALDVTVNNLDRFPLIWNNSGNIANVLFQLEKESEGLVVGIDNECVCIKKKFDQFGKYLEKVKRLVHHLINTPKEEFSGMTTVRFSKILFGLEFSKEISPFFFFWNSIEFFFSLTHSLSQTENNLKCLPTIKSQKREELRCKWV